MPPAERRLWARLKNRGLNGLRFRRQHTIGPYIADFVCLDAMLVVELDGDQHGRDASPARDARRDAFIESEGFLVLRFWNWRVATQIDDVLQAIFLAAIDRLRERELHEGDASPASGGGENEPRPDPPFTGELSRSG